MRWTVFLLTLLLALSGCSDDGDAPDGDDADGGDDDGNGGPGTDDNATAAPAPVSFDVSLSGAYPATIAYTPSSLTVTAGAEVTISFTNSDQNALVSHDWVLEGFEDAASTDLAASGETVEVTFTAPTEPGDYVFYCSVPGHRGNGMEGTFTVTAA